MYHVRALFITPNGNKICTQTWRVAKGQGMRRQLPQNLCLAPKHLLYVSGARPHFINRSSHNAVWMDALLGSDGHISTTQNVCFLRPDLTAWRSSTEGCCHFATQQKALSLCYEEGKGISNILLWVLSTVSRCDIFHLVLLRWCHVITKSSRVNIRTVLTLQRFLDAR